MTLYEKWSLALTAIGYLFVASSILYAARQWLVAKKSLERDILKDTRTYLSEISERIHSYQRDIIEKNLEPSNLDPYSDDGRTVVQLLDTITSATYELEAEFYDRDMLEKYITVQAVAACDKWKPFINVIRCGRNNPMRWTELERLSSMYKQIHPTDR